ncbi:hypothetical protein SpCBS45565_g06312 [Spizellomyces sp. 'palustris']|nr:hypothetical protein SpCBS45565_g06312 [Spizellomyces sp. 'palustris']
MPLVILCGLPCSGKTTRAHQLKVELEQYIRDNAQNLAEKNIVLRSQVIIVNDESLRINKREAYESPHEEKKARGALISAIERHLSREDIVICDAMNYIKGFRYQLYCIARALGTPHCSIHCGVSPSTAETWNTARDLPTAYDTTTVQDLCTRFEEPDARNRWDAPLFTLIPSDPLPIADIASAVILRRPPPPNLSTVVKPLTETNYLHEMDRTTQEIVDTILAAQKEGITGDTKVPKAKVNLKLPPRVITLSELRRLRRQYTNLNKLHTQLDMGRVADGFVEYLNTNIG